MWMRERRCLESRSPFPQRMCLRGNTFLQEQKDGCLQGRAEYLCRVATHALLENRGLSGLIVVKQTPLGVERIEVDI
jgi:hypothetical protein